MLTIIRESGQCWWTLGNLTRQKLPLDTTVFDASTTWY